MNKLTAIGGSRRLYITFLSKLAVTIAAFVLLSRYVDFNPLLAQVGALKPLFVVLAVAIAALQVILVGVRWQRIIAEIAVPSDARPPWREIQAVNWSSQFINQVIPFAFGEALRVLLLSQAGVSLRVAFKSALLDRGIAVLMLAAFCVLSLSLAPPALREASYFLPIVFLVAGGIFVAAVAIVLADPIARLSARWRVVGAIAELLQDMRQLFSLRRNGQLIVGLYVVVHLMSIGVFFILSKGVNAALSLSDVIVIVPLMLFVSTIPISFGGWGVREGFIVLYFSAKGMDTELALLLGLSFGTVLLLAALPGAFSLILSMRSNPRASHEDSAKENHRP